MAEVSVPITNGRTGEILYVAGSKRMNSSARSSDPKVQLLKGAKVIITDQTPNHLIVAPWTDTFTDPDFDTVAPN
jgi:hypothetical protein